MGLFLAQEEANVDYVVRSGAGLFASRPDDIASIVGRWLCGDRGEAVAFAANARLLGRPDAKAYREMRRVALR